MLYRLCTENVNYEATLKTVSEYFDGFTVIEAIGFWKGGKEHTLIIEIVSLDKSGDGDMRTRIEKLCYSLKKQNSQQAVLVQRISEQHDLL